MVISEVEARHGLLVIDQVKILVPTVRPVIVEPGEEGLVIAPLPETNVQTPVPVTAVFAAMVAVPAVTQMV